MSDFEGMELNNEDIKMLAELELKMDLGEQPFVVYGGGRVAVPPRAMEEFSLVTGQTINHAIFESIIRFNLAEYEVKEALKKITS